MPYRSNRPAVLSALAEQKELAQLCRDARFRRTQVSLALGAIFTVGIASIFLAAGGPSHPRLQCHKVTMTYLQDEGVPPPPAVWTSCAWR
jgi:hypothetical protein